MPASAQKTASLEHPDSFVNRHIGPSPDEIAAMLQELGYPSLEALADAVVPAAIRAKAPLALGPAKSETEALAELKGLASKNKIFRSYIGTGYHGTVLPGVIRRNVLENPGWYTQYTPYQPEIAQGRLEALLNFQTMAADLSGLDIANASMLDEATAAAEAMALAYAAKGSPERTTMLVADSTHPQTIALLKTRAKPLGLKIVVAEPESFDFTKRPFAVFVQYPDTRGAVRDFSALAETTHKNDGLFIVAADLLSLTILKAPGEFGADIAVGSTQRFGVPLGFGGPHAAYFAAKAEHQRRLPGRIVGVSKDRHGKKALRLALQTREQHIRREKATSNICTSQVLLAVMASMYAVYHGPEGLKAIAKRVRRLSLILREGLKKLGHAPDGGVIFDTVRVFLPKELREIALGRAREKGINLRIYEDGALGISLDETVGASDLADLFSCFATFGRVGFTPESLSLEIDESVPAALERTSSYLQHPVFARNRSETEMLRYIRRLESRDLSLTYSMIPLGSCTMKLNATSEMLPVSWPEFSDIHPFAPAEQAQGYAAMIKDLESSLAEITGFSAVSLQPNAGSQGEYAGLLVIRQYHESRGEAHRDVCLIPQSAHGTNPASAAMAGLRIIIVACDENGNVDLKDLKAKAEENSKNLAALMVTYPSTHGVFEPTITEICSIVHRHGGQVYLDGANMNAQVGLCRPGDYGADVCHLNLHKTFCIPHGGGGPGMGPIATAKHLSAFLPGHPLAKTGGAQAIGAVSAAPWGSAAILPITWMYIKMMGADGLAKATAAAILNANYLAKKLDELYPVLYKGEKGLVAHECIIDLRPLKNKTGVQVDDIARRLMDHGYHAPTISFPVAGTIMIEPTESESKEEMDIFLTAMTAIREELAKIERGELDKEDNPLKNAPHTAAAVSADAWPHRYSREAAAYPSPWTKQHKFWPSVGKIDAPYGDRNLICSCSPVDAYS